MAVVTTDDRKSLVLLIVGATLVMIGTLLLMVVIWEPNWYGRFTDIPSNIPSNYHFPDWLNYLVIPASVIAASGCTMIYISSRI